MSEFLFWDLFDVVFPILWVVGVIFVVKTLITYYTTTKREEKVFKQMVLNPSNAVVTKYIVAFRELHGNAYRFMSSSEGVKQRDAKIRQAQGFKVVWKSPNVSEEIKMQLYNAFLAEGVSVHND